LLHEPPLKHHQKRKEIPSNLIEKQS